MSGYPPYGATIALAGFLGIAFEHLAGGVLVVCIGVMVETASDRTKKARVPKPSKHPEPQGNFI